MHLTQRGPPPCILFNQSNPINLSLWAILLIWIIDMQDLYAYTTPTTNTIQYNSTQLKYD